MDLSMWAALVSALFLGVCAVPLVHEKVKTEPWDILKLTQSWPPGVCIFIENEKRTCNITSDIKSWIIHGLWPTQRGHEGPNYCNKTWTFDVKKVESLRPKLDHNWPSIQLDDQPEMTWKHEWEKHGTCGTSLTALKDEFSYFNFTLGLHYQYNLQKFLGQHAVVPRTDQKYQAKDLLAVLKDSLGAYPTVTCVKDKHSGKFYLEQVELCMDKTFKPVNCDARSTSKARTDDSLQKSLLFQPEHSLQDHRLQDYLVDCPDSGIYYKPMDSS